MKSRVCVVTAALLTLASPLMAQLVRVPIEVGRLAGHECVWLNPHQPDVTVGAGEEGFEWKIISTCGTNRFRVETRGAFGFCETLPAACEQDILIPDHISDQHPCLISPSVITAHYCYTVNVCPVGQSGPCTANDPDIWIRRETVVPPSWLAGRWVGVKDDVQIEEYWSRSDAGRMHGLRLERRGDKVTYEFREIEKVGEGLTYVAIPPAGPMTSLPLTLLTTDTMAFMNATNAFPRRIEYAHRDGQLRVAVKGTALGAAAVEILARTP